MIKNESSGPFLKREEIRRLKKAVLTVRCVEAAKRLLVDSTRKGHDKLSIHRYAILRRLDAQQCAPFEKYYLTVATRIDTAELRKIFEHVDQVYPSGAGATSRVPPGLEI